MNEMHSLSCEAIRHTLASYTWSGDMGDEAGYVSTFAPDGVLAIKNGATYCGRKTIGEAFRTGFGASPEQLEQRRKAGGRFAHHVSSLRIEITSSKDANCWAYFAFVGPDGWDHWGRYTDRMVLAGQQWLIAHRRVSIDGHAAASAPNQTNRL
ncbi:MAG: hypothetical protein JWR74_175 [Polaromonas sp.]|jgi:ketosteroid isomerase-like protein|nr:hypothetical protein [Polaromonas sp.]